MITRILENKLTYALVSVLLMTAGVYLFGEHHISLEWSLVFILWSVSSMLFACTLAMCDSKSEKVTQTHVSWAYGVTILLVLVSTITLIVQTAWSIHYALQVS